jgi:uncharacterized Ntn-hydrolase superfamily protein
MTFSIVAWDPFAGPEWGVAVASKFLAVGAIVPWGQAGAGAIATQALANVGYGPDGLAHLTAGRNATDAVDELLATDRLRSRRQVGVVDGRGETATYTGGDCLDWAGGKTGLGYACQGNILTGPEVIEAVAGAFEASQGTLARRLLSALAAGDAAGGDLRGRQSAAILVVRAGGGYAGGSDVAVDLRVDDHQDPMTELDRLMGVHELLFPNPVSIEWVEIEAPLPARIRRALIARGLDTGKGKGYSDDLRKALFGWVAMENLEERWSDEAKIDKTVLDILLDHE